MYDNRTLYVQIWVKEMKTRKRGPPLAFRAFFFLFLVHVYVMSTVGMLLRPLSCHCLPTK